MKNESTNLLEGTDAARANTITFVMAMNFALSPNAQSLNWLIFLNCFM
ncbi:hypothetical protein GH741_20495 [Aquibacillus halophilus]|uniref:Uncharacterized protein n=1 Tax=Aquibacillus halophilus TaxID=930132 RepID=A0A6A8DKM4_9BACI|nr:hypothetical protein [Aquibacillus halophilus]MRH45026.1 hypothetical protein [Aquibacillus halophilus]